MKAITIHQPWASLIAHGNKTIETRSFPVSYRGPIAIHAGKHWDDELEEMVVTEPFRTIFENHPPLPLGSVIATAQLIRCVKFVSVSRSRNHRLVQFEPSGNWYPCSQYELEFGDFATGRYGWMLRDIKLLDQPIPTRGQQGLWEWIDASSPVLSVPK